jgi:hypothetical protein
MVMKGAVMEPAITAIVYGAMLFVLAVISGVIAAVMKEFQPFQVVFPRRRWIDNFKADLRFSGDIWLLVGGGLMMILGLLVLLASKDHPGLP